MGKIITVNGPPGSGKTVISVKLVQALSKATDKSVLYLSPDIDVPAMGMLFPCEKPSALYSLGAALLNVEVTADDLLAVAATTNAFPNVGYLGYKSGENSLSYPALTAGKVNQLMTVLRGMADYIIVDCHRSRADLISVIAEEKADQRVNIINPDARSIAYYGPKGTPLGAYRILNILRDVVYPPIDDVSKFFEGFDSFLPYSKALPEQCDKGMLPNALDDNAFRSALQKLVKAVR